MKKRKTERQSETQLPVKVEVLRPAVEEPFPQTNVAALDLLVQKRVAEVLAARDEFIFEPFYRSRQVAYEIRRLQTVPERKKWGVYFERHGCVACGKRDQPYASSGFCVPCHQRVFAHLKAIVSELMAERKEGDDDARLYLRPSVNRE